MKLPENLIDELTVRPGSSARLAKRSTTGTKAIWASFGEGRDRRAAEQALDAFKGEISTTQEVLFASGTRSVLVIFQSLDAAGKDGTIKHVFSGVNPQGCQVTPFGVPSAEELRHDFLWRCVKALPERGHIGIFNRSYYEEVLVVRVHPELLVAEHLPSGLDHGDRLWEERFEDINTFEHHLERSGTRIVKFFLHISKDEQRRRFLRRLDDPLKQWKFSPADLVDRGFFEDFQRVYEKTLTATSTSWAPWHVIPADEKPVMRALVGGIVADVINSLDLRIPTVDDDQATELAKARRTLMDESGS